QIVLWVKAGGLLVMMANDSANVELPHFNNLAVKFGLHFNNDLQNHVIDDKHFKDGEVVYVDNDIFKSKPKLFLKDVCSISLNDPNAKPIFKSADGLTVIAATVKYGKGMVFAVGDPWLYNEYVNGRLPVAYQNDVGAKELTAWLKKQIKK
ncbi:MAG: unsaturated rhamnogalacturonyl hydrolase, partial [Mucilaginibacter sp.]|nr:unsaturated rhamnogalacturonyl hydrolase [Mucilaginibacter sp.]